MHFEYVYIRVVYVTSWWKLPGQDNADFFASNASRSKTLLSTTWWEAHGLPPRRQWIREHLLHGVTQSLWPHYGVGKALARTAGNTPEIFWTRHNGLLIIQMVVSCRSKWRLNRKCHHRHSEAVKASVENQNIQNKGTGGTSPPSNPFQPEGHFQPNPGMPSAEEFQTLAQQGLVRNSSAFVSHFDLLAVLGHLCCP